MNHLISILAPMYNEEQIVNEFYNQIKKVLTKINSKYDFEIIFVHDESSDKTLEKMIQLQKNSPENIGIIDLTRNFGLEGAINAGLSEAVGDITIVIDADLQDPPEIILNMIEKYEQGYEVVHGVRKKRLNDSFFKKLTAKIYYALLSFSVKDYKIYKNASNFKLLSSRALKLYNTTHLKTHFRTKVSFIGLKHTAVYYNRVERFSGKSNFNFKRLYEYAVDSLMDVNVMPLKIIKFVSILITFVSIMFLFFYWTSFNSTVFLLQSVLIVFIIHSFVFMLFFSITSEYQSKLMKDRLNAPEFLIDQYLPSIQSLNRSSQTGEMKQ